MARRSEETSIDALVQEAVEDVVKRASAAIARAVADLTAAQLAEALEGELAGGARGRKGGRGGGAARGRARTEVTRWTADRRARRVPKFVIELTGLDTKKAIVQKYGDGVVFEKGKPAPKP